VATCKYPPGARRDASNAGEIGLDQPALMVALLRPRVGEEHVDARERARRDHLAHHLHRVVLHHAHVGAAVLLDLLEQAAHARRVHLDGEVVGLGFSAAMRAVVSPMPEPISTITGTARPKISGNRGARRVGNAQRGSSSHRRAAGRGRSALAQDVALDGVGVSRRNRKV
jgi:hypothetical protein